MDTNLFNLMMKAAAEKQAASAGTDWVAIATLAGAALTAILAFFASRENKKTAEKVEVVRLDVNSNLARITKERDLATAENLKLAQLVSTHVERESNQKTKDAVTAAVGAATTAELK